MEDVDGGGTWGDGELGDMENLYASSQFFYEPITTLQEIKSFKLTHIW